MTLSPIGRSILRALRLGLVALVLLAASTTAAAWTSTSASPRVATLVATEKRDRQVLAFFQRHRWLLSDPRYTYEAHRQIRLHRASLAHAERELATIRRVSHRLQVARRHAERRKARRLAVLRAEERTPSVAICREFGRRYCREALQVARCESGLHTWARNGQYLGLFQMGWRERRLYGHGATARAQAQAAHRYFLATGRTWRPWSCKPWG